jgi:SulP family sulfate permease
VIYKISGAFFFGAAASVAAALERIGAQPKAYVIDFSGVSMFDSTAAATIAGFARKVARQGGAMYVAGARKSILPVLRSHGVRPPLVHFRADLQRAISAARESTGGAARNTARSADEV